MQFIPGIEAKLKNSACRDDIDWVASSMQYALGCLQGGRPRTIEDSISVSLLDGSELGLPVPGVSGSICSRYCAQVICLKL